VEATKAGYQEDGVVFVAKSTMDAYSPPFVERCSTRIPVGRSEKIDSSMVLRPKPLLCVAMQTIGANKATSGTAGMFYTHHIPTHTIKT
jgi:hypothetical protein